ncbi:Poly polymerase and DNA-Ligase Zn-finger region family protein [Trypanosoma theileri]|uniref:Poly polymerase and DNA-Ligase Zn-finger region family protein n=1 Tax=Trypanosoma theileri TaxID=67003 RepID=A0A1X0P7R0_9TRYP|nr:Poly polymerase and DNA-Ligase Zn-finger region family protein [Trypanosoma theileri]ORC92964.1 Poly polymerase and DNA-Ligase Zn-finger region family protein [Trypanosoma theileri]
MPQLRVEYAKSGRARCSLPACGQPIARHEVRIGTAVVFPARGQSDSHPNSAENEEGTISYKWRHLCCFTQRQLQNATAAGDLDNIEGFDDLAPADKALVNSMKRGELVDQSNVKGRVGDVANSPIAAELLPKGGASPAKKGKSEKTTTTTKKTSTTAATKVEEGAETKKKTTRTTKRTREKSEENDKDGAESDATIEYDVSVVKTKPVCPYGEKCFRTGAEHMAEYTHGTDADVNVPARPRAIIKGKKG